MRLYLGHCVHGDAERSDLDQAESGKTGLACTVVTAGYQQISAVCEGLCLIWPAPGNYAS